MDELRAVENSAVTHLAAASIALSLVMIRLEEKGHGEYAKGFYPVLKAVSKEQQRMAALNGSVLDNDFLTSIMPLDAGEAFQKLRAYRERKARRGQEPFDGQK